LAEILKNVLQPTAYRARRSGLQPDDRHRSAARSKASISWHIQIHPRLTQPAGFELGSGMSINPVLPEEAAALLREVNVDAPRSN
jgi:galactose-1-phosphate uridylyltransferase